MQLALGARRRELRGKRFRGRAPADPIAPGKLAGPRGCRSAIERSSVGAGSPGRPARVARLLILRENPGVPEAAGTDPTGLVVEHESLHLLARHAHISIGFLVDRVLELSLPGGSGVGGAVIAHRTPEVEMLEGRDDLAGPVGPTRRSCSPEGAVSAPLCFAESRSGPGPVGARRSRSRPRTSMSPRAGSTRTSAAHSARSTATRIRSCPMKPSCSGIARSELSPDQP